MAENHNYEHCECGHDHQHALPTSRIEEALKKYNLDISDAEVSEAVKKIIAEKVHENDTLEVKKFLMGSVEPSQKK